MRSGGRRADEVTSAGEKRGSAGGPGGPHGPPPPVSVTPANYKAQMAALFDSVAQNYDQVGPAFFTAIGGALVEAVGIPSGAAVLDVACGRGASLIPASRKAGRSGRVVGVDLSKKMITTLGGQIEGLGLRNVALGVMDAEELGLTSTSFDRVLCGMSLNMFPRPARALSEIHRVLKPGGLVGISSFHPQDPWWSFVVGLLRPHASQMAAAPKPEVEVDPRTFREPAILSAALTIAGFRDVQVECTETEAVFADEREWLRSLTSHGAKQVLDMMPAGTLERFTADAMEALLEFKKPEGVAFQIKLVLASGRRA